MYYIKDLQTGDVKEFPTLYRIEKYLNMRTQLNTKCVERKRIIQKRYVLSDSMNFEKTRKRCVKDKHFVVHEGDNVTEYKCNSYELCEIIGLRYNTLRQGVNRGTLMDGKYRVYVKGAELRHSNRPVKKERVPIRKKIFIFDTLFRQITEKELSIQELADFLNVPKTHVENGLHRKQKVKDRYYISYNSDIQSIMKQKKFKKTNAQLKRKKVDLAVNGEFTYREPNKPTVRLGKLGIDGIKNRFR